MPVTAFLYGDRLVVTSRYTPDTVELNYVHKVLVAQPWSRGWGFDANFFPPYMAAACRVQQHLGRRHGGRSRHGNGQLYVQGRLPGPQAAVVASPSQAFH
jgi:hypothetical protein